MPLQRGKAARRRRRRRGRPPPRRSAPPRAAPPRPPRPDTRARPARPRAAVRPGTRPRRVPALRGVADRPLLLRRARGGRPPRTRPSARPSRSWPANSRQSGSGRPRRARPGRGRGRVSAARPRRRRAARRRCAAERAGTSLLTPYLGGGGPDGSRRHGRSHFDLRVRQRRDGGRGGRRAAGTPPGERQPGAHLGAEAGLRAHEQLVEAALGDLLARTASCPASSR